MSETLIQPGMVINGYEIDSAVGEGGMATVFMAMQISLNRNVALKVLHQKFSKRQDFLARFEQESASLAQLQHPNIISIIDRGVFRENYYFVMEFLEGSDLDQLLAEFELTMPQVIHIINEVGKGMAYVHDNGIVHRDMKPANILIASSGVIKVSDFGIASIARGSKAEAGITSEGAAMGTGVYMAPEQMADARNVDQRADIYALAATFYKLLTRKLPSGNFPAPSRINDEIPVAADDIIMRAMDPEPDKRPESVREFTRELILALRGGENTTRDEDNDKAAVGILKSQASASSKRRGSSKGKKKGTTKKGRGKTRKGKGKKGKKQETSGFPLWAIVLVLAVAGGGVFLYFGSQAEPEAPPEQRTVRPQFTPQVAVATPTPGLVMLDDFLGVTDPPVQPSNDQPGQPANNQPPRATPQIRRTPRPTPKPVSPPPTSLSDPARMVLIPRRTTAYLGSNEDLFAAPMRAKFTGAFYLDRFEVSNADWAEFVKAGGAPAPLHWNDEKPPAGKEAHPVHGVSLREAAAYARWIGKRLPTEEEWETAISFNENNDQRRIYSWGNEYQEGAANIFTGETQPVGSAELDATPTGIIHAAGNVAEWTTTPLRIAREMGFNLPDEAERNYIIKGGSAIDFTFQGVTPRALASISHRAYANLDARIEGVGFRCARNVTAR